MITIRKSDERGFADHGWLKSRHTFSFASYYDKNHMGFRSLRVINEDFIAAGTGFGSHPHKDMEIITYVVKGTLEHKDSMGTQSIIRPGEVQRMTAGRGVIHSEYNHEKENETHLFQIWIMPSSNGGDPGYGQKSFENEINSKDLVLVVSNDGRDGSIKIKQDANMYISRLKKDKKISYNLLEGRGLWIQVIKGKILSNEKELLAGDAAQIEGAQNIEIMASEESELIIFDLA